MILTPKPPLLLGLILLIQLLTISALLHPGEQLPIKTVTCIPFLVSLILILIIACLPYSTKAVWKPGLAISLPFMIVNTQYLNNMAGMGTAA
jgi:hypothetical protein